MVGNDDEMVEGVIVGFEVGRMVKMDDGIQDGF